MAPGARGGFLELHRSLRATPVSSSGSVFAFLAAASLSFGIVQYGSPILEFHESVRRFLLDISGTLITGHGTVAIFGTAAVSAAITAVETFEGRGWLPVTIGVAELCICIIVGLRVPLLRSLMYFFALLIAIPVLSSSLHLSSATYRALNQDSRLFVYTWLKSQFVMWVLMPWCIAALAAFTEPAWWKRTLWIVALPAYSVIWSSIRLAFCASVLSVAGPDISLFLWSVFGIITDLVSLCLFCSLVVYSAGRGLLNGT